MKLYLLVSTALVCGSVASDPRETFQKLLESKRNDLQLNEFFLKDTETEYISFREKCRWVDFQTFVQAESFRDTQDTREPEEVPGELVEHMVSELAAACDRIMVNSFIDLIKTGGEIEEVFRRFRRQIPDCYLHASLVDFVVDTSKNICFDKHENLINSKIMRHVHRAQDIGIDIAGLEERIAKLSHSGI